MSTVRWPFLQSSNSAHAARHSTSSSSPSSPRSPYSNRNGPPRKRFTSLSRTIDFTFPHRLSGASEMQQDSMIPERGDSLRRWEPEAVGGPAVTKGQQVSRKEPTEVTGGCLCGGVRYTVHFERDHDWIHGPHTCQCTQCRKMAGSLIVHYHTVRASELHYTSTETLTQYASSPQHKRCFCSRCGSSIAWQAEYDHGDVELCVGGFDENYLLGEREADGGRAVGGFGWDLANPNADHFWVENEILGVTSELDGTKFLKGGKDEPV